ncbi:hypothetical protein [Clavibacter michiganensis]|uniref:hypothetical protein n=1 Tax=Clavibacter michiganensis TaxID=28447 RepID=UPI000D52EBB5|nr:hypothetical protein [Clavibacter michiganensis]AWF99896.1 hypothetical protein BEH61_15430 [Clavibacter michiganensis subsp. insidiosus]
MRIEHIPTTSGRRGTEGMTVVHDRHLMRLLYARDACGSEVTAIPKSLTPAPVSAALAADDAALLVHELSVRWIESLEWAIASPSREALVSRFFETGDLGPMARAIPPVLATPPPGEAWIDTEARDAWIESADEAVIRDWTSQSADRLNARAAARARGLAVVLVLPIAAPSLPLPGTGGMLVSDFVYMSDKHMAAALDCYA